MSQGKGLSAAITALIRAPGDHAPDSDVRLKARALHWALLPSAGRWNGTRAVELDVEPDLWSRRSISAR